MPLLSDLENQRTRGQQPTAPVAAPVNPFDSSFKRLQVPKPDEFRGRSVLEKVLDYTARPQRALVGGIRGAYKDDLGVLEGIKQGATGESQAGFKEIFEDMGANKGGGFATYGGMVADAVVDPLNALPVGAIGKLAKTIGGGVATGIKALPKGVEAIDKLADITRAAKRSGFARGINAFSGMDPEVKKAIRLGQAESRTTAERVISELTGVPSATGKGGMSALDDISQEDLAKLIGRQKHEQTRRVIQNFTKTLKPGQYKPNELVRLGDVEGFGPVKAIGGEALQKQVKALRAEKAKTLAGMKPGSQRAAAAADFDSRILDTMGKLQRTATAEDNLMLPKDFIENLIQDTHSKQLPEALRKYDRLWKKMATVWNPRFHVNNFVGNLWNMGIGATDKATLKSNPIKAYKLGRDFMKKVDTGNLTTQEQAVHEALRRYGVDTGLTSHINYDPNDIEMVKKSAKRLVDQGGVFEKGATLTQRVRRLDTKVGKLGDKSERAAKIGTVLQELEKGKSLEDAVLHAKDVLFDYQELTPEMRAIRNMIAPFWTFKLKNTGLQGAGVLKHPAWYGQVGKLSQNLDNASKDAGTYVTDKERYEDDVFNRMVSLPLQIGDVKIGSRNPLPIADLNSFGLFDTDTRAGQNATEQQADAVHPLIQSALKLGLNVDIRRPGSRPKPAEGVLGDVTGTPFVQMMSPAFADNYKNSFNKEQTEQRIPFLLNEIVNQVPLANNIGRIAMPITDPGLNSDPLAFLAWFGVPVAGTTPQSRQKAKANNAREYSRFRNSLRRKEREKVE